jgi:hypothetical protein
VAFDIGKGKRPGGWIASEVAIYRKQNNNQIIDDEFYEICIISRKTDEEI